MFCYYVVILAAALQLVHHEEEETPRTPRPPLPHNQATAEWHCLHRPPSKDQNGEWFVMGVLGNRH